MPPSELLYSTVFIVREIPPSLLDRTSSEAMSVSRHTQGHPAFYSFGPCSQGATQSEMGAGPGFRRVSSRRQVRREQRTTFKAWSERYDSYAVVWLFDNPYPDLSRVKAEAAKMAQIEAEEAERAGRQAAEAEARRIEREARELQASLARKKEGLPEEPGPEEGSGLNIMVRMPDGSRQSRRFRRTDPLQVYCR